MSNFSLTPDQEKSLGDIAHTVAEESAVVMSTLLDKKIDINVVSTGAADSSALGDAFQNEIVIVESSFATGFDGSCHYLFNKPLVAKLSDLMMMGDGTAEFSEDHIDAIQEGVNQMMGAAGTSLGGKLGRSLDFQPSMARLSNLGESGLAFDDLTSVLFELLVEGASQGQIAFLLPYEVLSGMSSQMGQGTSQAPAAGASAPSGGMPDFDMDMGGMEDAMPSAGPMDMRQASGPSMMGGRMPAIEGLELGRLERERLELLLDVKLDVSIELGRSRMLLRDILELGPGAVIELDKMAGETVDLLINDKKLAEGEVVVVDENFGVRITHLVSMEERIKMLQTT